jgi:hypothetical protein
MSEQVSLPKVLPPAEAFKICKEKLGSIPEIFEKILIDYSNLSGLSNELRPTKGWQLDWTDDRVLKHYVKRDIRYVGNILMSANYMGFENVTSIHIFGITEDGELFMNEVDRPRGFLKGEFEYMCELPNGTKLFVTNDEFFKRFLGFTTFAPDGAVITTSGEDAAFGFRLQGDVVADLCSLGIPRTFQHFKHHLREELSRRLYVYMDYCVTDLLYATLLEHGLSPTLYDRTWSESDTLFPLPYEYDLPERHVVIEGVTYQDFRENINGFTRILGKYFKVLRIHDEREAIKVEFSSDDFGTFVAVIKPFGYSFYSEISIVVYSISCETSPMAVRILDEFEKTLNMPQEPSEIRFWLGNHRVRLRNFISRTIRFTPSYEPIFFENRPIPVTVGPRLDVDVANYSVDLRYRFISLEGAEIHITHREHGSKTVKVEPYNILRLRIINTSNDYTRKRNRAIFRVLNEENIDV